MARKFYGCTIEGKDFHDFYDNPDFRYFNIDWDTGKLKIKGFNLYKSLGKLNTTNTTSIELKQEFEGNLNLYKEQLEEALNGIGVDLITINPEQSEIGELVSLKIMFDNYKRLLQISATLNPSPPAPPSDTFQIHNTLNSK